MEDIDKEKKAPKFLQVFTEKKIAALEQQPQTEDKPPNWQAQEEINAYNKIHGVNHEWKTVDLPADFPSSNDAPPSVFGSIQSFYGEETVVPRMTYDKNPKVVKLAVQEPNRNTCGYGYRVHKYSTSLHSVTRNTNTIEIHSC